MSRLRLNCAEGLEPSLFGSHCNTPEEVHIVMGALGLFVYPTALLLELYVHVSAKKRFLTRDFEFKAVRILRATNIVAFLLTTHPLAYDRDWDDQTPEAQLGFVVGCTSFVYGVMANYRSLRRGFGTAFALYVGIEDLLRSIAGFVAVNWIDPIGVSGP